MKMKQNFWLRGDFLEFSTTYIWLAIAIIMGIIEAATLGITTIWFAIGALIAMVTSMLNLPIPLQVLIFIISSVVLLYFTRPIVKKYGRIGVTRTNADRLIGEKGLVTEKIDVINGTGQVKVFGQIWSARSVDNKDIEAGEMVEIKGITGVKLVVGRTGENTKGE